VADFYGRLLIPPTIVAHNRPELEAAVAQIRQAFADHQLADGLVAIERSPDLPVWRDGDHSHERDGLVNRITARSSLLY
jgi:hypothetical protein